MESLTYKEFIQNILDTRGRFACGDEYHERHHIVPKSCGGGNEQENLIDLYAREHFIAHKLLALENPDNNSLVYAWSCMAFPSAKGQKRYELTPEEYEEARIALSKNSKERMTGKNNPNYGKHLSDKTRKKMSAAQKGENHPFYGKCHSEETRQKLSEANTGENNPMYGKHHTKETKEKISEANKGKMVGGKSPVAKIVLQFNKNFKLIGIWVCVQQATQCTKVDNSDICKCCKEVYKTAGGFIWRYLYDVTRRDGTIIPGAITLGLITEEEALEILANQKET